MTIPKLRALGGLDRDLQQSLLNQIRDLWTHTSTALEGNTLTLGETKLVIEEGLTVSGKPLKDHQEVMGHARAIALIYEGLDGPMTESRLFDLHRAVPYPDRHGRRRARLVSPDRTSVLSDWLDCLVWPLFIDSERTPKRLELRKFILF